MSKEIKPTSVAIELADDQLEEVVGGSTSKYLFPPININQQANATVNNNGAGSLNVAMGGTNSVVVG